MAIAPDPIQPPVTKTRAINPAFRYLGIPTSWLQRGVKLPSRNTSVFLLASTSLVSLFVYDRHQCKKIRQEYVEKVKHLSEEITPNGQQPGGWLPKKVTVYGARIPEDVEVDRAAQWFKKYVKPVLVSAAIDYTIQNGTSPGTLGRKIATDIQSQRIIKAAQEKDGYEKPDLLPGMPGYRDWMAQSAQLEIGTFILGRSTLKEYLWGLRQGYKQDIPLDGLEEEERFAQQLETEGIFETANSAGEVCGEEDVPVGLRSVTEELQSTEIDDLKELATNTAGDLAESTKKRQGFLGLVFQKLPGSSSSISPPPSLSSQPPPAFLSSTDIPPQPALVLVPFDHPIGMRWWPLKIFRFFHRRHQVLAGAESAMRLIEGPARGVERPNNPEGLNHPDLVQPVAEIRDWRVRMTGSIHLDFLAPEADDHIRSSYRKKADHILQERELYRTEFKERLSKARTRAEVDDNGQDRLGDELNESQLRLEAIQKEQKWRDSLEGWKIVRPGSGVCWEPEMEHSLRVFEDA